MATESERLDKFMAQMAKRQATYEEDLDKRFGVIADTLINTADEQHNPLGFTDTNAHHDVANRLNAEISKLKQKVGQLQAAVKEYALPFSLRWRNDGASGTHRLEIIHKATPYSTGTTPWSDDLWSEILGADGEIYTP